MKKLKEKAFWFEHMAYVHLFVENFVVTLDLQQHIAVFEKISLGT